MRRGLPLALGFVALLAAVHAWAAAENGWMLPDDVRARAGASAATVFSRAYAHFTAPLFHENPLHLAYNAALLLAFLPPAVRAFGVRGGFVAALLASPAAGVLVDVLVVLPLAALGAPYAVAAAPERLVGASVVGFAALGMTLSRASGAVRKTAAPAVIAYEALLAAFALTQGFVFAYHVTGFALGLAWGAWRARRAAASS